MIDSRLVKTLLSFEKKCNGLYLRRTVYFYLFLITCFVLDMSFIKEEFLFLMLIIPAVLLLGLNAGFLRFTMTKVINNISDNETNFNWKYFSSLINNIDNFIVAYILSGAMSFGLSIVYYLSIPFFLKIDFKFFAVGILPLFLFLILLRTTIIKNTMKSRIVAYKSYNLDGFRGFFKKARDLHLKFLNGLLLVLIISGTILISFFGNFLIGIAITSILLFFKIVSDIYFVRICWYKEQSLNFSVQRSIFLSVILSLVVLCLYGVHNALEIDFFSENKFDQIAESKNSEFKKYIEKHGYNGSKRKSGYSLFLYSVLKGNNELVEYLSGKIDLNKEIVTKYKKGPSTLGYGPFELAVASNKVDTLKTLINLDELKPVYNKDKIIHAAIMSCHADMLDYLFNGNDKNLIEESRYKKLLFSSAKHECLTSIMLLKGKNLNLKLRDDSGLTILEIGKGKRSNFQKKLEIYLRTQNI